MRMKILGFGLMLSLAAVNLQAAGVTTPLIDAVKRGDAPAIRGVLARHADVNAAEVDGTTALHWAVERDGVEAVELLVRAGANVKAVNRYGVSPLSLAAENGNAAIIERLLKAGADPNATLPGGETVLMTAARTGKLDAVKLLLAHGANVNAAEETRHQTALMWAAGQNNVAVIRTLVEAGADIKARSMESYGPRLKINANARTIEKEIPIAFTPLLFAVRSNALEAVGTLLEIGANVNDTTTDGTSALVIAVTNAHWDMASLLLDKGADPNADKQGWNALHELARTRSPSVGQVPPPTPSGRISSIDLAKKIVAHGVNVNATMTQEMRASYRTRLSKNGATAFLLAAKGVDVDLMRLLAASGADTKMPNKAGTTPLMAASGVDMVIQQEDSGTNEDAFSATQLCLTIGCGDVNAVARNGETALHGAARRGAAPVVQLLLDSGANLDVKTKAGLTPLDYAIGKSEETVRTQPATTELLRQVMRTRGIPFIENDDYLSVAGARDRVGELKKKNATGKVDESLSK